MTDLPRGRRSVFSEMIVHREGVPDIENPYWDLEEPQPHPDPSRGCIRRGLCCRSNPGWFAPGEVELAAAHLGLSPDELVRSKLVIDWHEVDGQLVHVFAPAKVARDGEPVLPAGARVDALYQAMRGPCIYFDGEGCSIYAARPYECRGYDCTNPPEDNPSHLDIARMWLDGAA